MNKRFEEIYATNAWGYGSGEGSLQVHTAGYARLLESFDEEPRRKQRGIGSNRSSNRSKLRGINP